ncbi:IS1380 family transposase [Urbifossiella limnaea]|uniref:IS1380 family transposase n=1 Tax=Urbifossiella limnaea TaxID=2528023 RepID=UPI00192E5258|nr:IS1380 family transposase [Urbifossiella limnaea]
MSDAPLTSDAGLLPLRQFDDHIGLTAQFAGALHDPRDPDRIDHTVPEMVRSRVFGILAGYADQDDHDTLRTDPVFKLIADRSPTDADLASQPTLSRFENMIDIPSLFRLRDVLIDQLIGSFAQPPFTLTFDLDAVDDPTHGSQQLTLLHAFYEQYQYLPLVITCAENDAIVVLSLRHGTAAASLGADNDLEYLVTRLRAVWPNVRIRVRGDGGFGNPTMYEVSERLDVIYTYGLSTNPVLQRESDALLAEAVRLWDVTHGPQRLFAGFWYQAGTWTAPRWVVVKAEANAQGTNRRFVTTNRPGAQAYPEATYDEYAMRGESENRNKEFKCGMAMDRLSDHRFMANYLRLYLHAAALNLSVRLRREIADPPPAPAGDVPVVALPEPARKRYRNARRRRDPLGEGQPATWRLLLIKVAASVVVSCRRIVVRLSGSWPHQQFFERVAQHVARRPALPHFWSG